MKTISIIRFSYTKPNFKNKEPLEFLLKIHVIFI